MLKDASEAQKEINVTVYLLGPILHFLLNKNIVKQGSGCGSVGRAVLPIPEICGSNPVIGKKLFIINICLLSTVYWKDENNEKEAGNGPKKIL